MSKRDTPVSNPAVNEKQRRALLYAKTDLKFRAYIGLWQFSDVSANGVALFQYLLMRQGNNPCAFPSFADIKKRFNWTTLRVKRTIEELEAKLPEVFKVERGVGKGRHKYKLTRYKDWPEQVCQKMWQSCESESDLHCESESNPQPYVSESESDPLLGNSIGDQFSGDQKAILLAEERAKSRATAFRPGPVCCKCALAGASFQMPDKRWVCAKYGQCYNEAVADDSFPF